MLLATDPVLISILYDGIFKTTETPYLLFSACIAASVMSFALHPLVASSFNSNQKITALLATSVATCSLSYCYSSYIKPLL